MLMRIQTLADRTFYRHSALAASSSITEMLRSVDPKRALTSRIRTKFKHSLSYPLIQGPGMGPNIVSNPSLEALHRLDPAS
jgi:hypothetical protein